jgi:hypothetical protein
MGEPEAPAAPVGAAAPPGLDCNELSPPVPAVALPPAPLLPPAATKELKLVEPPNAPVNPFVPVVVTPAPPAPPAPMVTDSVAPKTLAGTVTFKIPPPLPPPPPHRTVLATSFLPDPPPPPPPKSWTLTVTAPASFVHVPDAVKISIFGGRGLAVPIIFLRE